MEDLLIVVVIGLLAGAASRLWYPANQPYRILSTMAVGLAGALVGGMLFWAVGPGVTGKIQGGAALTALFGSVGGIFLWQALTQKPRGTYKP
jgi:uncharacterized membrane protein YeaQ/YmgE (transglycosylase-associated protein family)